MLTVGYREPQKDLVAYEHFSATHFEKTLQGFIRDCPGPFLLIQGSSSGLSIYDLSVCAEDSEGAVILGRDPGCHLIFTDPTISRQHARVHCQGRDWKVQDMGSRTGTFHGGRLAPLEIHSLKSKQHFGLGKRLTVLFVSSADLHQFMQARHSGSSAPNIKDPTTKAKIPANLQRLLRIQRKEPLSLACFLQEVQHLDQDPFLRFFPSPVLVLLSSPEINPGCDNEPTVIAAGTEAIDPAPRLFWMLTAQDGGHRISVGRDASNNLVLNIPSISRKHAEFSQSGHGYRIQDLGSRNGVTVNGEKLTRVVDLPDRAVIQLGKQCRLKFLTPQSFWYYLFLSGLIAPNH